MIKKNDLVKQFELLTLQEIKNFNDSLSTIYNYINEIKSKIEENNQHFLESFSVLYSIQTSLKIEIDNFYTEFINLKSYCENEKSNQNLINQSLYNKLEDLFKKIQLKIDNDNNINKSIDQLKLSNSNMDRKISELTTTTFSCCEMTESKCRKDLIKFKEEIVNLPSESSSLRKEFDEKIAAHKVNVDGLLKEIRENKKHTFIQEKKIEALFTLIDKLKKNEVIP